jgi:hypothetical protein
MMNMFPFITPNTDTAIVPVALIFPSRLMLCIDPFVYSYRAVDQHLLLSRPRTGHQQVLHVSRLPDLPVQVCEVVAIKLLVPKSARTTFCPLARCAPSSTGTQLRHCADCGHHRRLLRHLVRSGLSAIRGASRGRGGRGRRWQGGRNSYDNIRDVENERYLTAMSLCRARWATPRR